MIPDLGKYTEAVLSSYTVSIVLLLLLVAVTLRSGRKARRALAEIEERRNQNG